MTPASIVHILLKQPINVQWRPTGAMTDAVVRVVQNVCPDSQTNDSTLRVVLKVPAQCDEMTAIYGATPEP